MFSDKVRILLFIFFTSCHDATTSENKPNSNIGNSDSTNYTDSYEKIQTSPKDTTGFFSNCQELMYHSSLGSLQSVEADKDSLKNLYFAACYDCKTTFEIVFSHKVPEKRKDQNYKSLSNEFTNGCAEYFKNFNCFAFVCPMRDPDKQKDVHAMNIDFPVEVRVYERTADDIWEFVKRAKVKNFKDYALLQFKSIYHLE